MFKFITRQHCLVNLLVALGLFFGIIFTFLSLLKVITRHNQYEKVPEVVSKSYDEAFKILDEAGFEVEVQDSVWDPKIKPLTVIKQAPEPNQMVKASRIIYLTVNRAQPPLIDMPNLVGFSFRNALMYIEQVGLVLGDTTRKPDIARDAVLEQLYNGRPVTPGTRLFAGSKVSFVLGSGLGDTEYPVPDLIGLTLGEARAMLSAAGVNIGAIIADPDVKDKEAAYVYRQNPATTTALPDGTRQVNRIREGQSVDLYLSVEKREKIEDADTLLIDQQ
ncbi:MAG: PASTA domain-containing protein [Chitinophagaceae bacterium]|nr:PASTA domain-containing protein [Chitinophagaceae bacterium]